MDSKLTERRILVDLTTAMDLELDTIQTRS